MKSGGRILGIDDAPHTFDEKTVTIVGALVRPPCYLEAVMTSRCEIDGTDATAVIIAMMDRSRYREQVRAIMLDGIALGGFNVVDIHELAEAIGAPVITITRDEPDLASMESALRKHHLDWENKLNLVKQATPLHIALPEASSWISCAGCSQREAEEIVRMAIVRGGVPEPVRMAHLIATAIGRGESRGL
ncbi:MAG: DUF99 family protein [Methanomassiliicoccales archaeon]